MSLIVSNRKTAGVHDRAATLEVKSIFINKEKYEDADFVLDILKDVDYIILAGFLKLIPAYLVQAYPNRIINIHPALLPKYGGHGMYGQHVHQAVFNNKEKESGMTIHYVNEAYDEGQIIMQGTVSIVDLHNAKEVAKAVLKLEHYYYPRVIEAIILNRDISDINHP